MNCRPLLLLLTLITGTVSLEAQNSWQDKLVHVLPLLGHRNWIVLAEPSFPLRTSPGIEVEATGLSQMDLVTAVLDALAGARHVRPVFYTAAELAFVSEQDANGISSYRAQLATLLKGGEVSSLPEDQIEAKMDDVSRIYHVLVLKSTTPLPYSTVFISLDDGYWSADAEKRLRAAMQPK